MSAKEIKVYKHTEKTLVCNSKDSLAETWSANVLFVLKSDHDHALADKDKTIAEYKIMVKACDDERHKLQDQLSDQSLTIRKMQVEIDLLREQRNVYCGDSYNSKDYAEFIAGDEAENKSLKEQNQVMNDNCISLNLHESRMKNIEAENKRLRKALENESLKVDFVKAYYNPKDTSFKNMIDAWMTFTDDQKEKLINLCNSLRALSGKGEG